MENERASLHSALGAQEQRHTELGQILTERVCQGTPAQMFESSFTVDAIESDSILPARCGHLALPIQASDCQVVICVGGIEGEDWQASCFGAVCMHEDVAAGKPKLQPCAVHSNVQEPLNLCESAACTIGDSAILLCGGRTAGEEQNSIWLGKPIIHTTEHHQGSHLSKEGMSDNAHIHACSCEFC